VGEPRHDQLQYIFSLARAKDSLHFISTPLIGTELLRVLALTNQMKAKNQTGSDSLVLGLHDRADCESYLLATSTLSRKASSPRASSALLLISS
jgi:hypothetical protein